MDAFFRHSLVKGPVYGDRDELLLSLCAGRRVLHVGCADAPMTSGRLDSGTLLHQRLMERTAALHGVDIDERAVALLDDRIGGDYTIADVSEPAGREALSAVDADVVLAGDVIEHVPNAGSFVGGLARLVRSNGPSARLVLSTPNGLSIKNTVNTLFGRELVHPDHVALYTPVTLRALLLRYDVVVERACFYHTRSGDRGLARAYDAISRVVVRVRPAFAEGQIVVCRAGSERP